jgi:ADP-ribose pyrophosphatase YjhB (NUDIX family)
MPDYRNPIAVVAGILLSVRDGPPPPGREVPPSVASHILLVRRSGTHRGSWCIPCGYIEYDEEIRAALAREMREETGLTVEARKVYAVHSNFHDPEQHTVGTWFLTRFLGGGLKAGDDASDAGFFPLQALPGPLAFPTDLEVLVRLGGRMRR